MLEAKKGFLISRSLLMFRIRFCSGENLGKAFSRKSLFPSFFFSFYHFQMINVEGLGVYKYETRVFLCHAHPAEPQRCVRVPPSACHLSSWTLREQKRPDEGRRPPARPRSFNQRLSRQRPVFKRSRLALNCLCSIGLLCGLSCTHETHLALSF